MFICHLHESVMYVSPRWVVILESVTLEAQSKTFEVLSGPDATYSRHNIPIETPSFKLSLQKMDTCPSIHNCRLLQERTTMTRNHKGGTTKDGQGRDHEG